MTLGVALSVIVAMVMAVTVAVMMIKAVTHVTLLMGLTLPYARVVQVW